MQRRYDRQIIIQRATVTQSSSGETIETWEDITGKIFAFAAPTKGSERFASPQEVASQEVTFTFRFHEIESADRPLRAQDRILYPADALGTNAQRPGTARIYDILHADEVGRRIDWSVKTLLRADVFGDNTDEGSFPSDGYVPTYHILGF